MPHSLSGPLGRPWFWAVALAAVMVVAAGIATAGSAEAAADAGPHPVIETAEPEVAPGAFDRLDGNGLDVPSARWTADAPLFVTVTAWGWLKDFCVWIGFCDDEEEEEEVPYCTGRPDICIQSVG